MISFARGYQELGALVNIMVQTFYAVRHFMLVIVGLIGGFTLALQIYFHKGGADTVPTAWHVITHWDTQIYGGGLSSYSTKSFERAAQRRHHAVGSIILFEAMKFVVALLLLNLLIAIMNSVYEDIKNNVNSVLLYEKSRIILDIQTMWLPVVLSRDRRPKSYYFPRWLLILAPASDDPTWRANHHRTMTKSKRD